MSATALKAKSALAGDELYQRRGRAALPILVRQVRAGEPITYSRLADELEMPNHRNCNFVLGAAGRAVVEYGERHGIRLPPLTAIVVNKTTGLPSEGVAEFLDEPAEYRRASQPLRRRIIDRFYVHMGEFRGWERMLRQMGLEPQASLRSTPRPMRGMGGEGEPHRRLKDYIATHPQTVGLSRRTRRGVTEEPLASGDTVDVLFDTGRRLVAVEVKASDAPDSEIERGMYQCVKYAAVLRAMQKALPKQPTAEAWLALGGVLPQKLVALRNTLGVTVLQNVGP